MIPFEEATIVTIKVRVPSASQAQFIDWQMRLNQVIASFSGFVSLEFLSSNPALNEWIIIQRFDNANSVLAWRQSQERVSLIHDLEKIILPYTLQEDASNVSSFQGGVTEVFVTQVNASKEQVYRDWIAKMHQAELKFPGFRGVFVQSPSKNQRNWITLLQFDTPENLDRWLSSPERRKILKDAEPFIESLDTHRMVSPFAGWFSSVAERGAVPPVWKQTMLVLLVLFPIVMLELKFLSPLLHELNSSLATFIGNAISVTLVSWPMMPIVIWLLRWWLAPESQKDKRIALKGALVVGLLYVIEIALFWKLLKP